MGGVAEKVTTFGNVGIILVALGVLMDMTVVAGLARIVRISESTWREAASHHAQAIRSLLLPGMTDPNDVLNSGHRRRRSHKRKNSFGEGMMGLDPKHPVYNFLMEYYGIKGPKGIKRLARWSPDPAMLLGTDAKQVAPCDGILLEGATEKDMGGTLHLKGAMPISDGVEYSPAAFYRQKDAAPFLWYRSVIQNTLRAEPVLHCHGLHEWALQYQPAGAPPPPSAKYQHHLPLRVSQEIINHAVERRGISCTHVDALRFFAPAARPLNRHGAVLKRTDQLNLEQPACVHAHMDLLKMSLRLQPYVCPNLVRRALEVSLEARRLDVAASPYDARAYGVSVVKIETAEGRAQYRRLQTDLMKRAEPVRRELLEAYDVFLELAFDDLRDFPAPERYAKAEPGGLPWRKNLIKAQ